MISEMWRTCSVCWESVDPEEYDPLWQACSICAADLCREELEEQNRQEATPRAGRGGGGRDEGQA